MMIIPCLYFRQDTVPAINNVSKDSFGLKSDSSFIIKSFQSKNLTTRESASILKPVSSAFTDTVTVCERNRIADITFYDSNNVVSKIESAYSNRFPFLFIEKNREMEAAARSSLVKQLRQGSALPTQPLHDEWIIGVIIIASFLYSLILTTSKNMFPGFTRFFLFRGINDPASRDISALFQWQSTILNLISFLIIGLFVFCAASFYNYIPSGFSGIIFWLISFCIIILAVTLRHIVCLAAGNLSGEREVFREYLIGIYQSYRFSGMLLFIIVILMSYTTFFPAGLSFTAGLIVLGIMYLIRIARLLIIFLNRNISIFYLILYLCALEILPVLISVKYFTGLV